MKLSSKANLYLILATLMWGATFPLTRNALIEVNPFVFVSLRFALATLVLLPSVWVLLRNTRQTILRSSLIIRALNAGAYLCQTIGLQTVHSARAAFITGGSVILVPFLAPLFKLERPSRLDLFCTGIGFIGVYVLMDTKHLYIGHGELWFFLGAIFFSLQITYLQRINQLIGDYQLLAFYQLLFTVPFVFLFTKGHSFSMALQAQALIGILFCAVFATSLAYYLQNKYQKFTSASKAALIFALEPVFASLFGVLINHEVLAKTTIIGSSLLLLSLILPAIINMKKEPDLHSE